MRRTIKAVSAPEVAYLLRRELGPIRAWNDCLTDMRIGKTDVCGVALKPVCLMHDKHAWRPHYELKAVAKFIIDVRGKHLEATRELPPVISYVEVDTEYHWKTQKVKPLPPSAITPPMVCKHKLH